MRKIYLIILLFFAVSCNENMQEAEEDHSQHIGGLHLSDQQIKLGHIKTEVLKEHYIGEEIILTGVLVADQNKTKSISSKVMGRIDKIYFKNKGEKINKGDILYEIYSEELNLIAREYRLALSKKKSFQIDGIDLKKIISGIKNKLKLYGLSDEQIDKIEETDLNSNIFKIYSPLTGVISKIDINEGDYVMEGASVYHLTDYSNLWADIQVFIDDVSKINVNMLATVYFPGFNDLKVKSKISFINPEFNSSSQITNVRIEIPNLNNQFKVGMQVNVSIIFNQKSTLVLPTDAVLIDGKGSTVWVKSGHNQFKNVMVTTGMETSDYTEIIDGLNKGDTIVVSGAYLLNSEYLFKKGVNPMEGHDMSTMK